MMSTAAASSSRNTNTDNVPTTVEGIVTAITTTQDHAALVNILRSVSNDDVDHREGLFASFLPGGQDPLLALDTRQNTVGILFLLSARLLQQHPDVPRSYIRNFVSGLDPVQARLAPDRVKLLGQGIVHAFDNAHALDASLPILYTLLDRYSPGPSHLTPLHSIILRTAVSTRRFTDRTLRHLLSIPITEVSPYSQSSLDYNDALVYHYAGGIALVALKQWQAAAEFFEIVVSAPAQTPAAIQLEALKKLVLVQLLTYGKPKDLSKFTNQILLRLLKNSAYGAFVNAYPSQPKELQILLEKETIFATDKNLGLAKQAFDCASRWAVKRLTGTYITLSLDEIARSIGFLEAESVRPLVVRMIEAGEVDGKIAADGTVSFEESTRPISRSQIEAILRVAQQQGLALAELDRQTERSKDYLAKAVKHREDGMWVGRDGGDDDLYRTEKPEYEETLF